MTITSSFSIGSYYVLCSIPKNFTIVSENLDSNTIVLSENIFSSVGLVENNASVVALSAQENPVATIIEQ